MGHDTAHKMEGYRRELVKKGLGPKKHQKIVDNLKQTGNVFAEAVDISDTTHEADAEIIYFPGCVANYRMKKLRDATVEIFKALGVKYVIPKDLVCCGSVML